MSKLISIKLLIIYTLVVYIAFNARLCVASEEDEYRLSLSSIILFALDNNPDIDLSIEKENQGLYGLQDSKSSYYPKVEVNAQWGREYNSPSGGSLGKDGDFNNSGSALFTVKQLLYDGFSSTQEIKAQRKLYKSFGTRTKIKTDAVMSDAIKYYLSIYRFQNALDQSNNYYYKMKEFKNIVSQMYEQGGASRASLEYVKARMAMAKSERSDLSSSLNDAYSNLEFLTGYIPKFKADLPSDILDPQKMDLGFYVDYAKYNNNLMVLNEYDKNVLNHKIKAAEGRFHPKFSVHLEAQDKADGGGKIGRERTASALLKMNYQIFDGYSRSANLGKLNSQRTELDIKDRQILDTLKKTIRLSYNQISFLQESAKATEIEITANENVSEINNVNFKHGEINIIDLIDGEDKLKGSKVKKYKLESDIYLNSYRLLIASGVLNKLYFCKECEYMGSD